MSNQFSRKLLERKLAEAGSLRSFVEAELRLNKGNRAATMRTFNELLQISDSARVRIAREFVGGVYSDLRKDEEHKKRVEEIKHPVAKKTAAAESDFATYARKNDNSRCIGHGSQSLPDEELEKLGTGRCDIRPFVERIIPADVLATWDQSDWMDTATDFKNLWRRRKEYRSYQKAKRAHDLNAEKAASFDRMVLALDAIQVGNKLLGDCTGGDLLREAVRLEEFAKEATAQSVFYRQLASIVGKTATVREAGDRAGIVGLITSQYKETAEAA